MSKNIKIKARLIVLLLLAVGIGLGIGYLIFGRAGVAKANLQQTEQTTAASSSTTWTCSMHPQIQQQEAGDCPLCGMDLIPLEENSSNDPLVLEMTREAVKLAQIQTSIIGKKVDAEEADLRLSGKVQPDERLASSQVAHIPGRIEQLFVSFTGEQVYKGQKIAALYSPELITAQRELLEAIKLSAINPQLVEAARNKLRYWKIDDKTIQQIEQQGSIREKFTVYADQSGVVTQKRIAVGDYVQQGQALFDLINLRQVWVVFDAYEDDLSRIAVGDKIRFTVPSLPNQTFKTKVTFIDPIIDPQTRVAAIRTEVNNKKGLLKPEMFVYGTLQKRLGASSQTLTVPKSAVLWTGKRSVVYVKVPNTTVPSFKFREVEIGEAIGEHYQLISGLEVGEEVVTHGSFTIDAAAQLNNQASMMNQEVAINGQTEVVLLPDFKKEAPEAFQEQLYTLTLAYLELKNALVNTDGQAAQATASQLVNTCKEVNQNLLEGEAKAYWEQQENALLAHSQPIAATTGVKEQREQFDFLSQILIETIKVFGISQTTLYIQHCPMANNDQGADWISQEKEIRNPYFGDKMLTCGLVKTTIQAAVDKETSPKATHSSIHHH